jgi:hypothetical protein
MPPARPPWPHAPDVGTAWGAGRSGPGSGAIGRREIGTRTEPAPPEILP